MTTLPIFWQITIVILFNVGVAVLIAYLIKSTYQGFKNIGYEKYTDFDDVLSYKAFFKMLNRKLDEATVSTKFSILYISVDQLVQLEKNVNVNVIRKLFKKLLKTIKENYRFETTIGSYRRGEFLVYISEKLTHEETIHLTYDLVNKVREPYVVSEQNKINTSILVSVAFYPAHGFTSFQIIQALNDAMEEIKTTKGSRVRVCETKDEIFEIEQLDYYSQIKKGIKENQFEFFYQPIVNINTQMVHELSAFIRWNHPKLGVLDAGKFISTLEQSGDLYWVSLQALEMACKNLDLLINTFDNPLLQVSIHVGLQEFSNQNIVKDFKKVITKYKTNPNHIVLEVPVSALMKKESEYIKRITQLKAFGFKIKTDPTGIPFSDLKVMIENTIDIVKVSSFRLQEDEKQTVITLLGALNEMALTKPFTLLSTHIETKEQLDFFISQKVEFVQGRMICQELSIEALKAWSMNHKETIMMLLEPNETPH